MNSKLKSDWQPQHSIMYAQSCCLCLGVALLIWGMAPAVLHRVITGRTPALELLTLNIGVFALGLLFIGFHLLMRQQVRWATWAAYLLGVAILAVSVCAAATSHAGMVNVFLVVLSGLTTVSSWMAMRALSKQALEQIHRDAETPTKWDIPPVNRAPSPPPGQIIASADEDELKHSRRRAPLFQTTTER